MTFTRTQITSTNDADTPRVVHLGGDVIWYVYRRIDQGLYLQRETAGVRGPEIQIAIPVDAIDVVVDPDGVRAWIYFVTDGSLRRIEVTDKTETPTGQAVQRNSAWYERAEVHAGGAGLDLVWGFPDPASGAIRRDDDPRSVYPPTIAAFDSGIPGTRTIIIQAGPVRFGSVVKFRLYRDTDPDGAGFQLFAEVPLPAGAPFAVIDVPAPVGAERFVWAATSVSRPPLAEETSFSNLVVETIRSPGSLMRDSGGGGGLDARWGLTDRIPVKVATPLVSEPLASGGPGLDARWGLTDRTPLKYATAPVSEPLAGGGPGLDSRWVLDGVGVINP